jgi:putative hydrolase of the HAD superfamily
LHNRRYEQVFFDLDHTLWDFETNSRETLMDLYVELALQEKGIGSFDEFHRIYQHHNLVFWDRFRKGFIKRDELRWKRMWRTLLDFQIGDEVLARQMSERYLEILPTKRNLFHDTLDILDYLKGRAYPMHLITNGFENTQHAKIRNSGIGGYFTHVVTSEKAGIMKPHEGIFRYAMELSGATPEKSIMIGDTLDADISGAGNVGMDTAYFNPEIPADGDIRPTFVIGSLTELKTIL